MHPVAQRLSIHPRGRRCLRAGGALQDMRHGQSSAGHTAVSATRRMLPQRRRR
jgi:hypothetical protein